MISKELKSAIIKTLQKQGFDIIKVHGNSDTKKNITTKDIHGKQRTSHILNIANENLANIYSFLDGSTIFVKSSSQKVTEAERELFKTKAKESREQSSKDFKETLKEYSFIKDAKNHPILKQKKIKSIYNAKIDTRLNLFVPYRSFESSDTFGALIMYWDETESKLVKFNVPGSDFVNKFHILKKTPIHSGIGKRVILISESWTTAATLADYTDHFTVICTNGINTVMPVASTFSKQKDCFVIVALDKLKKDNVHPQSEKQHFRILKELKEAHIQHIIPNTLDPRFFSITDFNDVLGILKPQRFKKYLNLLINQTLPISPLVMGFSENRFLITNPVTSYSGRYYYKDILEKNPLIANHAFWHELKKSYKTQDQVLNYFHENAVNNQNIELCGTGLFKDSHDKYVLNAPFGRFSIDKSLKIRSETKNIISGKNYYINKEDFEKSFPLHETKSISSKEIKDLISLFKDVYNFDTMDCCCLLGWIAQAYYVGFSYPRPAIWITGPSYSGKSNLMINVIYELMNGLCKETMVNTEASIRAYLTEKSGTRNTGIILVEEAEKNSDRKKDNIDSILEMNRIISMSKNPAIGKATKTMEDHIQRVKTAFVFASVDMEKLDIQEYSRMIPFHLKDKLQKGVSDLESLNKMIQTVKPSFTKKVFQGAFDYQNKLKIIQRIYQDKKSDSQHGHALNVYATVFAGWCSIVDADAEKIAEESYLWIERQLIKRLERSQNLDDFFSYFLSLNVYFNDKRMFFKTLLKVYKDEMWRMFCIKIEDECLWITSRGVKSFRLAQNVLSKAMWENFKYSMREYIAHKRSLRLCKHHGNYFKIILNEDEIDYYSDKLPGDSENVIPF